MPDPGAGQTAAPPSRTIDEDARARPIGVMDSGVGGLSVLREIRALMPGEDLLYVADSGYAPYGDRPRSAVERRVHEVVDFLAAQGAKAIVLACNTATEVAAESVRAKYTMPVVAMEPAIKAAAAITRRGVVGVLATRTTIDGHRVAALIERERGRDVQFLLEACPTLVELVERGDLAGSRTEEAVSGYVTPLVDRHADVIVLGCTHFHWLRSIVSGVAGAEVTVIDPGGAVARQLHRRLDEADLLSRRERPGLERFWSSSREDSSALFTRLWGSPVQVHPLSL